jgi:hypothetical protein
MKLKASFIDSHKNDSPYRKLMKKRELWIQLKYIEVTSENLYSRGSDYEGYLLPATICVYSLVEILFLDLALIAGQKLLDIGFSCIAEGRRNGDALQVWSLYNPYTLTADLISVSEADHIQCEFC